MSVRGAALRARRLSSIVGKQIEGPVNVARNNYLFTAFHCASEARGLGLRITFEDGRESPVTEPSSSYRVNPVGRIGMMRREQAGQFNQYRMLAS